MSLNKISLVDRGYLHKILNFRTYLEASDTLFAKIMTTTTNKAKQVSIDELWESAPISEQTFNPTLLTHLPKATLFYLQHAIEPGAKLASAVRLWMHGEIKLGQKWHHFKGEEVISWHRGMIWRATTWMQGLPIWGADRAIYGNGSVWG